MSFLARLTCWCTAAVLLGGCAWDGPTVSVRVVPEASVGRGSDGADVTPESGGSDGAGGASASNGGTETGASDGRSADGGPVDPDAEISIVPPFPGTVAVVGDSLTLSASEEITAELTQLGLDVLVVDGVESRRMTAGSGARPSGLDAISTIRDEFDEDPDLWVIALGTNDVGAQANEEQFRNDVQATLAGVGQDAPLVWVDLWIRDRRDAVVAANGVIRDELADRSSPGGVVGWFAEGSADGLITGDGVHLTDRGREAFASAIADRVRSIYDR